MLTAISPIKREEERERINTQFLGKRFGMWSVISEQKQVLKADYSNEKCAF